MTLSQLVAGIPGAVLHGDGHVLISGVSIDSRTVRPGELFVALDGQHQDGRKYVAEAVRKGAAAVAGDGVDTFSGTPVVMIQHPRALIGTLSSRVFGEPALSLSVVGVTGTNGKTTVSCFLESLLTAVGRRPGYIGTVGYRWGGVCREASRTTPEATDLHRMLREMVDSGVTDAVIECSSHALELGRLKALDLDVAVFTNLTSDHLDFHGDASAYAQAKRKLFDEILLDSRKPNRAAVFNVDDSVGREWKSEARVPAIGFSTRMDADICASHVALTSEGVEAEVRISGKPHRLRLKLVGEHNLSNALAALAAGHALGLDSDRMLESLEQAKGAPGRLEPVPNDRGVLVFVDYAHTDDALLNVIRALEPVRDKRLIVVFGCGGDRDRGKRPRMAHVVGSRADVSVLTSDNPRSESPDAILDEISAGLPPDVKLVDPESLDGFPERAAVRIVDRADAIAFAIREAREGDIVLIAGKGHETSQESQGVTRPFDDRIVAAECLKEKSC